MNATTQFFRQYSAIFPTVQQVKAFTQVLKDVYQYQHLKDFIAANPADIHAAVEQFAVRNISTN